MRQALKPPKESTYYSDLPGFSLKNHGIHVAKIYRNASPAKLYEQAVKKEKGVAISSKGALIAFSGEKTGRSPKDKRVVDEETTRGDIWWGEVNIPLTEDLYYIQKTRAIDYLNTLEQLYVFDGFAGADKNHRIKVRVICYSAYHALFMHNMLIRPTCEEIANFGEPDFVIYNAGKFPAFKATPNDSSTIVAINFKTKDFVILGTEYAGEMKKGVFTIMNYYMPKSGLLSLHSSCNEGPDGSTSLFFGLSGTGKTTLSTDPKRRLIGDDEHVWSDTGVFNIEGGCYAKCINLDKEKEPDIYNAIKFGSILENVVYDNNTREVDFNDSKVTENTRASYPIEFINGAKTSGIGNHPKYVILLTCDAFGVLPPVSKLTPAQAMYHFLQGYTAKVAGTEVGVTEPQATFSSCFGAPFLVWHPTKYANLLSEKLKKHGATAFLINTGWTGGQYGVGKRISLKYTRAIIDAIHDGSLLKEEFVPDVFGLLVPKKCKGVPDEILSPKNAWKDKTLYAQYEKKLHDLFAANFQQYIKEASEDVIKAGPSKIE